MRHTLLCLTLSCAALSTRAAESTEPVKDLPQGGIATIEVTARKQSEDLEQTPISITALSGDDLRASGVTDIGKLQQFAPNLSVSTAAPLAGSANSSQIFIRGIGQTDFTPNTSPGVGLYLDGVYMPNALGSVLNLLDVQSVEILRGPQGTLFGRNTIGGAVSVTTQPPRADFGGFVEADGGSYGEVDGRAGLNLPISEKVHANFSLGSENNDGWVKRLAFGGNPGSGEGNKHLIVGRGAIDIAATDQLDLLFAVDGSHDKGEQAGTVPLALNPAGQFSGFYNGVVAPALVPTLGTKAFFNNQYLAGPYATYANGPNTSDDAVIGASLTATEELGAVTLKSITAYRNTQGYFAQDYDFSPLNLSTLSDGYRDETVSEEFQVIGKALAGRLNYVAGIYYSDERAKDHNLVNFPVVEIWSGGYNDNSSKAVFGQFTYRLLDDLSVTGGLRETQDTTSFLPSSYILSSPVGFVPGTLVVPAVTVSKSFLDLSPEFNLAYNVTPDLMSYFNFSQGYKSGGFTQRVFPPLPAVPAYAPEYATVYEIGAKTTIGQRLRLNGDVFHTDYTNVQVTYQNGIAPQTSNAAAAAIDGAELEITAVPIERLTVTASGGYTDARYTSVQPGAAVTLHDRFPFTPKWNLSGSLSYDASLPGGWTATPRADVSYRSAENYDAQNPTYLWQKAYAISNLAITLRPPEKGWEAFLHINNLFDRRYLATGYDQYQADGWAGGIYGAPRIVVGGVRWRF